MENGYKKGSNLLRSKLNYELIGQNNYNSENLLNEILTNRNVTDIDHFLNISEKDLPDPYEFSDMNKAIELYIKHIEKNSKIGIIVDSDADGLTSASMIYRYTKHINPDINIQYFIHKKKTHGIDEDMIEEGLFDDINFLIIPDASSLDYVQHKTIAKLGTEILIIDHHPCTKKSQYTITINNQYDNKFVNLSGAGMVYIFCKALDKEYWEDYSEELIDLAAVGIIADDMNTLDYSVQYIIRKGLSNIKSNALQALIDKQNFALKGELNPINISFNIAPMINSVFRVGEIEDRQILFEAFADIKSDRIFPYTPTKGKNKGVEIPETLYEHCARMCESLNGKRKRTTEKLAKPLEEQIDDKDKIICVEVEENNAGMTGLLANILQSKYYKPTIVYSITQELDENENLIYRAKGSMRSFTGDFKTKLLKTNLFKFVAGHQDASGLEIKQQYTQSEEGIQKFKNKLNEFFKDTIFKKLYLIDFLIPMEDLSFYLIKDICYLKEYYSKNISEPLLYIKDVEFTPYDISLMGANQNTIKINTENGFEFIKFKTSIEEYNTIVSSIKDDFSNIKMDIIGRASLNEYQGEITPQIIITDWSIINAN